MLFLIILAATCFQEASADLSQWESGEKLAFAAHYRIKWGQVQLLKKWAGSKQADETERQLLGKKWIKANELDVIVVYFWSTEEETSFGWSYKIINEKVVTWDNDPSKDKLIALGEFYNKINNLRNERLAFLKKVNGKRPTNGMARK